MFGSDITFWIMIGAFIGWNLPQPFWAIWIQMHLIDMWKSVKYRVYRMYLSIFNK